MSDIQKFKRLKTELLKDPTNSLVRKQLYELALRNKEKLVYKPHSYDELFNYSSSENKKEDPDSINKNMNDRLNSDLGIMQMAKKSKQSYIVEPSELDDQYAPFTS